MDWLTNVVALTGSSNFVNGFIGVSLKAALVLCGALVVTAALRRASASTRHRVLAVTLLAVLALPALSVAMPAWQVPFLPPAVAPQAQLPSAAPSTPALTQGEPIAAPFRDGVPVPGATPAPVAAPSAAPTPEPADLPAFGENAAPAAIPGDSSGGAGGNDNAASALTAAPAFGVGEAAALLLAAWLLGTAFLLARLAVSTAAAWWLVRHAPPVADAALLAQADGVRRQLGIGHPVRVVTTDRVSMPMAWGVFRPTVLLPAQSRAWTAARRRVVLLHEMAHLKRRDCQTLLLARLVTALHWFNPLAWTATRRLHAERERACDDLVLSTGTRGADYAQHLLEIARSMGRSRQPGWATVAMARPNELEGRLLAILDPQRKRDRGSRAATGAAVLGVGILVLPLAALQPSATAPEQQAAVRQEQSLQTETLRRIALQRQLDLQLQRQIRLQFDIQPRIKTKLDVQLPLDFRTNVDVQLPLDFKTNVDVQLPLDFKTDVDVQLPLDFEIAGDVGIEEGVAEALAAELPRRQEVNPRVVQAFLTALQDEDAGIRAQAANSLGMIESEQAVAALAEVLRSDADADVRSEAAWALGMIESDEAVAALTDALTDADADVRSQAVWALGMIESDEAVPGLSGALSDEDPEVRSQAAWALGMIEDAAAVDALSTALRSDASAEVRSQAAWALGMIEDDSALEALLDALTDEDLEVRKSALWAVGHISG